MSFKFEKLRVWQKSMDLGEELNGLVSEFPARERYNLSSQLRRAADSIALNISEGSIGQSVLQFQKFIGYAIGSLAEVVTCLHKAKRRGYIRDSKFDLLYENCYKLMNMLISFRNKIE